MHYYLVIYIIIPIAPKILGSDVFSTSTDGRVLWWDIRKLGEPVETLPLEFAGYRSGQKLGGIALEYESTMVSFVVILYTQKSTTLCSLTRSALTLSTISHTGKQYM